MGLTYAVANQKGGVGKTTTAVSVAACLAEGGAKVLLVDFDPQSNATVALGYNRSPQLTIYELLAGACTIEQALHSTPVENLSLIRATAGLAAGSVEIPRMEAGERILRLLLEPIKGDFDYIFIDCPPSLGALTISALAAADRLIIPVQAEYFALEGLASLLDTVSMTQGELNPKVALCGIVITMHDQRTRLSKDVEQELKRYFPTLLFDTIVPRNIRLGEAPSYGVPVIHHDPHSTGASAYFALAKEIVERG